MPSLPGSCPVECKGNWTVLFYFNHSFPTPHPASASTALSLQRSLFQVINGRKFTGKTKPTTVSKKNQVSTGAGYSQMPLARVAAMFAGVKSWAYWNQCPTTGTMFFIKMCGVSLISARAQERWWNIIIIYSVLKCLFLFSNFCKHICCFPEGLVVVV